MRPSLAPRPHSSGWGLGVRLPCYILHCGVVSWAVQVDQWGFPLFWKSWYSHGNLCFIPSHIMSIVFSPFPKFWELAAIPILRGIGQSPSRTCTLTEGCLLLAGPTLIVRLMPFLRISQAWIRTQQRYKWKCLWCGPCCLECPRSQQCSCVGCSTCSMLSCKQRWYGQVIHMAPVHASNGV